MNELRPTEMTKEELEKILDEYRDKNVQLEAKLDVCKKNLAMAEERERQYMDTIESLSEALKHLSEAVV